MRLLEWGLEGGGLRDGCRDLTPARVLCSASRCGRGRQRDAYPAGIDSKDQVNLWDEPRDLEGVNITYEVPSESAAPLPADVPLAIATASLNKLVERVTDDKSHGLQRIVHDGS